MAFSFRQIQYFVAAAENGALSCAARELSISQSTVAEPIRDVPESTVCHPYRHRWDCLGGSLDERFYHGCYFLSDNVRRGERRPQSICGLGDTARFRLDGCRFNPAWQRGRILVRRLHPLTHRCEDRFLTAALQAALQQSFHHAVAGFQLVERNELVRLVALIH